MKGTGFGMTIRVICRWIGECALRGFVRGADAPGPPLLAEPKPVKVLAICPRDNDHLLLRMAAFHDGWNLTLVRSYADGFSHLRRGGYAIVLYDADLPAPDWRQALQRLASPTYDRMVILMSSRTGDEVWRKAMELGAFDVIEKPILGTELLAMVSDARHVLEAADVRARG